MGFALPQNLAAVELWHGGSAGPNRAGDPFALVDQAIERHLDKG
jgi:hypothetical protein